MSLFAAPAHQINNIWISNLVYEKNEITDDLFREKAFSIPPDGTSNFSALHNDWRVGADAGFG